MCQQYWTTAEPISIINRARDEKKDQLYQQLIEKNR